MADILLPAGKVENSRQLASSFHSSCSNGVPQSERDERNKLADIIDELAAKADGQ